MKVEIYTIPGCIWCDKAMKLFAMANITEYEKHIVGETMTDAEFLKKFPLKPGFPVILFDGEDVHGVVGAAKRLIDLGLVSSKKK